jgi:YebC/PmpR family DNA-binding regulatory protein
VALFIETLTDNANRTVADIRYVLARNNGSLGTSGSVSWQFDRKGMLFIDAGRYAEDVVLEAALLAGAEDVRREGDEFAVTSDLASFHAVQEGMKAAGVEFTQPELTMVPQNEVAIAGSDAEKLIKLLDALEELDDVQKVHTNADIDDEILASA